MTQPDGTPADPSVRVVVLNWNAAWFTSRCVESLLGTDYPEDRFEVVVVDNGSVDGSAELLRSRHPHLRMIENRANLGFAEGCNRALRDLGDVDLVALVNNDTVVEPGWLRPLVDALVEDPGAAAAAAQLVLDPSFARIDLDPEGAVLRIDEVLLDDRDVTGRCRFDGATPVGDPEWPLRIHQELHGPATVWVPASIAARQLEILTTDTATGAQRHLTPDLPEARTELLNGIGTALTDDAEGYDIGFGRPVDEVDDLVRAHPDGFCGGGVVLRVEALDGVGLFDPAFFAYYEDTDLSWRLRRAGWRIVAVPTSRLHHAFGAAGGSQAPWFFHLNYRNWLLSVLRNGTGAQRRAALAKALDETSRSIRGNVIGRARRGRRPSFRLCGAWLRVWLGVLVGLPAVVRSRRTGVVGRSATERVVAPLQQRPSHPPPRSRPDGPLLVYLDLAAADRSALAFDPDLDVVAVVRDGREWRRCTPAEVAVAVGGDPGRAVQVDPDSLVLATPDPYAVLVGRADGDVGRSPLRGVARVVELSSVSDDTDLLERLRGVLVDHA